MRFPSRGPLSDIGAAVLTHGRAVSDSRRTSLRGGRAAGAALTARNASLFRADHDLVALQNHHDEGSRVPTPRQISMPNVARAPLRLFFTDRKAAPVFAMALSRRSRHQVAFGLFGLFCTKQPLVLLLLEFRFGHRICSRIRRRCTFAR